MHERISANTVLVLLAVAVQSTALSDEREETEASVSPKRRERKEVLWNLNGRNFFEDIAYSPDGRLMITGCQYPPYGQLWDAATGVHLADLNHTRAIRSVCIDRSGKYFATAGFETSACLWRTNDLSLVRTFAHDETKDAVCADLALSWDGSLLAYKHSERSVEIWDTKTGARKAQITGDKYLPSEFQFTRDGQYLVSMGGIAQSRLWKVETGQDAGRIEAIQQPLGFLPSGELLAVSADVSRNLIALDLESRKARVLRQGCPDDVVAVSADGRYLLSVERKRAGHMHACCSQLTVWDVAAKADIATTHAHINTLKWRFSPNGDTLIAVDGERLIWRWDLMRRPAREEVRTWTDESGKFSVEASFEELNPAGVQLRRTDGTSLVLPLHQLGSESREFLAAIPTAELSADGPSPSEEFPQISDGWVEGYGTPVDPDGDCTFLADRWFLTIDVPGSQHDLSAEIAKMNAPRILQRVDCDFVAQVEIDAGFAPQNGVTEGRTPYHGAGIVAMQDEKNYIRVEHAAVRRAGHKELHHYVNVEVRRNGVIPPGGSRSSWIPDMEINGVGLERRGSEFIPFANGKRLVSVALPAMRVLFPAELDVGLVAINASTEPFSVCFKHYELLPAK